MRTIINAAPGFVDLGVDDQSEAPYTRTPEEIPQHLPKFLIYAKKGPSVLDKSPEKLLGGNERNAMYGTESFVIPSKYFTHPVIYANAVNAVAIVPCTYDCWVRTMALSQRSVLTWMFFQPRLTSTSVIQTDQ